MDRFNDRGHWPLGEKLLVSTTGRRKCQQMSAHPRNKNAS